MVKWLYRVHDAASRLPTWLVTLAGLVAILAIALADYLSGDEVGFSIFYMLPVTFVTWHAGRAQGLLLAVLGVATWSFVDWASGTRYSSPVPAAWDSVMRLGFFALALWLLDEIHRSHRLLHELASTDSLTGVRTARSFYGELEREIDRRRRYGRIFALAYIDLDRFKDVNDTFGHAAGDDVLRQVARAISSAIRKSDTLGRLGGDEFGIVMPETDEAAGAVALSRIHEAIRHALRSAAPGVPGLGATIGVVVFESCPDSASAAVKLADDLMYEGKRARRDVATLAVHRVVAEGRA